MMLARTDRAFRASSQAARSVYLNRYDRKLEILSLSGGHS